MIPSDRGCDVLGRRVNYLGDLPINCAAYDKVRRNNYQFTQRDKFLVKFLDRRYFMTYIMSS